jgi:hypothetical protein
MLNNRDQALLEAEPAPEPLTALDGEGEAEEGEAERDLDDDIPDADAGRASSHFNSSSPARGNGYDEQDDDDEDDEDGVWADEIEVEDALPGEEGDGDYGSDGVVGDDSMMMGGERDLDDDVPEAGSYQHTDTDLEDSSDETEDEGGDWVGGVGFAGAHTPARPLGGRLSGVRNSVGSAVAAVVGIGGSVFGSSPGSPAGRERAEGRRRVSGRGRLSRGTEN